MATWLGGVDAVHGSPAFLQQTPLFSDLQASQLEALSQHMIRRSYRRGQIIFQQGDPGTYLYAIETGRVKITIPSASGREMLVAVLGPGDFFGELALIDGQPRSATATALSEVQAYILGRQAFIRFLLNQPEAALAVCTVLASRLRQTDERLGEVVFLDLPGRLAKRLLEMAEQYGRPSQEGIILDLAFSQREIGELVGASRQSINRVLGQWQRLGLIKREGRHIVILRPEALRRRII